MDLLTINEMRQSDAITIEKGVTGFFLMERAGAGIANAVEAEGLGPCHVCVLAGPGNNGGDAYVAARDLLLRGYKISIISACLINKLKGDALKALNSYQDAAARLHNPETGELGQNKAVIEKPSIQTLSEILQSTSYIVDGLFGAGLDRDIEGELRDLVVEINKSNLPVIAIDIPSGINGDTGKIHGCAIKATKTVTFFRPKPGHYLLPGRELTGQLSVVDIGISKRVLSTINPQISLNNPALWQNAVPNSTIGTHKYHEGALLVVGGDEAMRGAAVLSSNAAMRSSVGLVTLTRSSKDLQPHPNSFSAIMQYQLPTDAEQGRIDIWAELIEKRKISAALIGPGSIPDEATRSKTLSILKAPCHCVIDAGALAAFGNDPSVLINALNNRSQQSERGAKHQRAILTPHAGEFKYLFGAIEGYKSKVEAARNAANKSEAIIILKGADTVIASPDGRVSINCNAPETLATAGTGDVLAGISAALLAKHMPAFEAACAAVYFHAECANAIGTNLVADDLIDHLPQIISKFQ